MIFRVSGPVSPLKETKISIDTSKIDTFCMEVAGKCTEYARDLVCKQYGMFIKNKGTYSKSGDEHSVSVGETSYKVTDDMRACTCTFNSQHKLPCRHIFAVRFKQNKELFEPKSIPQRWLKADFIEADLDKQQEFRNIFTVSAARKAQPNLDTMEAKYKYAYAHLSELSKTVADILSRCSTKELKDKIGECEIFFHNLVTFSRNKKELSLVADGHQSSEKEICQGIIVESDASAVCTGQDNEHNVETLKECVTNQIYCDDRLGILQGTDCVPNSDLRACQDVLESTEKAGNLTTSDVSHLTYHTVPAAVPFNVTQMSGVLSIPVVKSARGRPRKRKAISTVKPVEKKTCVGPGNSHKNDVKVRKNSICGPHCKLQC